MVSSLHEAGRRRGQVASVCGVFEDVWSFLDSETGSFRVEMQFWKPFCVIVNLFSNGESCFRRISSVEWRNILRLDWVDFLRYLTIILDEFFQAAELFFSFEF